MPITHPAKRLALGTVQFGIDYGVANQSGLVRQTDVGEILGAAWNSGMRTLDTAASYGKSEQVLGDCGVQNWAVITKVPPIPRGCVNVAAWVKEQVSCSIQRLGIDQLYAVLLHRPDQILGGLGPQILHALEDIRSLGLTKKIGVSIYDPSELSELTSLFKFDLVQAPMNLLDRRLIDSGWAQKLKHLGVEIHIRSVFLQGLLLMSQQNRPLKFKKFQSIWSEWDKWLLSANLTPLQACLAYVLSIKEVDKLIVGVDDITQLKEIIDSTNVQLQTYPKWSIEVPYVLINPSMWDQL